MFFKPKEHEPSHIHALYGEHVGIFNLKTLEMEEYLLEVSFDDGKNVFYDLNDDIEQLPGYLDLKKITGLYESVQLDESRTCVFWNDYIDLPSDTIYEYGKEVKVW